MWNMPFKARTESHELLLLRILNTRIKLTEDVQKYYLNLEKGFRGEVQFDLLTEELQSDCLILNDLLLEVNKTKFQIDTTIIFPETIYLSEIKNFEGDFYYEADIFYTSSGKERKNPLEQLKRGKSLFRQLLQNLGYHLTVDGSVVFINPEFTLYQAPKDLPFIFPTQLTRFIKKLDKNPAKLNSLHTKLAKQLVTLHQPELSYDRLPPYSYEQQKKGITCKTCRSFSVLIQGKKMVCQNCGCCELVEYAVLRMVEEIKLLFPGRKTTKEVHEWCRVIECKKRIARILEKHYRMVGVRNWTYYQ
jgi:hypothetical protein